MQDIRFLDQRIKLKKQEKLIFKISEIQIPSNPNKVN